MSVTDTVEKIWTQATRLSVGMVAVLSLVSSPAHALLVTDVHNSGDPNTIENQMELGQNYITVEKYGSSDVASNVAPGYDGIVFDNGGNTEYFDKLVTAGASSGTFAFQFNVLNDTGTSWTGYRFEFFDATFTTALNGTLTSVENLVTPSAGNIVVETSPSSVTYDFTAPFAVGGLMDVNFTLNLDTMPTQFGIRQVALLDAFNGGATVPTPATWALLLAGGLFLQRQNKKRIA